MKKTIILLSCLLAGVAFGKSPVAPHDIFVRLAATASEEIPKRERLAILSEASDEIRGLALVKYSPVSDANEVQLMLWLSLIDRVNALVDKSFDPARQYSIHMPAPGRIRGDGSITPEYIRDPRLRAIYEADIRKYHEYVDFYIEQSTIASLRDACIDSMRRSKVMLRKDITQELYSENVREIISDPGLRETLLAIDIKKEN